ncbi:MAG: hypothetical protein KAR42_12585 [candidate division Zixibacteria bacterium]|nr:hypothetical protein [candidate division Zixibacteria bacterium]
MKKAFVIILTIGLLLPLSVQAGTDGSGGQAGNFRELKLGGRASALGGAFTAMAEGGMGFLYNSAGSAQSRKHYASFSYRALKLDRRIGFASFTMPAKEQASLSLFWLHAGTSPLESRDRQGFIIDGEDISYSENMFGINFSKKFANTLLIGAKVFYAQNNIANINAYTAGVDFGALSRIDLRRTFLRPVFPLLRFGATVENLGANYKWTTTKYWNTVGRSQGATFEESFPIKYRLGLALEQPNRYVLAADFEVSSRSIVKTHLGGEYSLNKALALRAGLDDSHPTFGAGLFKLMGDFAMKIDIAYLMDKAGEGDDVLISFDIVF